MPDLYPLARKLLFTLDAETAHHTTLSMMSAAKSCGVLSLVAGPPLQLRQESRTVEVMGLKFPNRVGLAAGLDKAGTVVGAFGDVGFGHIEIGTVTPRPQSGNNKPRLFRLKEHHAVINRTGFNNPGIEGVLQNLKHSRKDFAGILGINIGKNKDTPNEDYLEDYLTCFEGVYGAADYVTANLSSPNTAGLRDLQSAETCSELIKRLQEKREELKTRFDNKHVPIVIKIAPDLSDDAIKSLAFTFSNSGVDGVITTNTTIDRDTVSRHPLADETGGLSGKPLTEKATEVLSLLRSEMNSEIPIIGSGGVMSGSDAKAKVDAGASLVQVYSGLIYSGPALVHKILEAL